MTAPMADREPLGTELAVVGMAGRFPGAADVGEFWHNLRSGENSIRTLSEAELDALGVDERLRGHPGFVPGVAMLADPDRFDAEFFGVQPRDAELMDPQHRVFLECCWHALENAGCAPDRPGGVVSVFGATSMSSYLLFNLAPAHGGPGTVLDGLQLGSLNAPDFLASRVAYKLGFSGPAVSVSTACSSSLVAVHLAAQSLLARECDVALAGGVSVQTHHRGGYVHTPQDITAADGTVRPFDAAATGTVFGSGAGVVVLRRLEDALADGDPIRAVLLATAVNNDGDRKVGFTAPGVDGQADVIAQALANAELDAADIGYVEAHGTATQLGDSVEVRALRKVFGPRPAPVVLGSVKGNIGHLDAAAGVAGLIKTVLALQHRELPPTVHFERPAEHLELTGSPFEVSGELRTWPAPQGAPRRAGLSSFGVGGTNAHAVLEEAPTAPPRRGVGSDSGGDGTWQAVVVSAKTAVALNESARRLAAHLLDNPDADLADVAFTTQDGRAALPHRRSIVARDAADAARALADPDSGDAGVAAPAPPGVAFVFPGMGAYHHGMAARLYHGDSAINAAFRAEFDACAALIGPRIGRDLASLLDAADDDDWPDRPELAMPALFAVEYALGRALIGLGVRPSVLLGHSLGEYTAACLAGVLSVEDAIDIVCTRAELVAELPPGGMLSVALPEQRVRELLDERLSLAAVNGPESCVVSGRIEDMDAFARRLATDGVRTKALRVGVGFHSHLVEPVLGRFEAAVRRATLRPATLPLVSGLTGTVAGERVTDPRYWVDHLRQPVRFADAVRTAAAEAAVLVEVGPGQTLQPLLRMSTDPNAAHVLAVLDRAGGADDSRRFMEAIGRLWTLGVPVAWASVRGTAQARRVELPGYPFARTRFWIDPPRAAHGGMEHNVPAAARTVESGAAGDIGTAAWTGEGDATNDIGAAARTGDGGAGSVEQVAPGAARQGAPGAADAVTARIASILSRVSGLPADQLDLDANLFELGFDSLALVQAGDAIRQAFAVSVPLRRLFEELASIRALATFIAGQLPEPEPVPVPAESVAVFVPLSGTTSAGTTVPSGDPVAALIADQLAVLRRNNELQHELFERQLALLRGDSPSPKPMPAALPSIAATRAPTKSAPANNAPARFSPQGAVDTSGGSLTERQRRHVAELAARYNAKTAASKRRTADSRHVRANHRNCLNFRSEFKELIYPIQVAKGGGARFVDIDGNEYVDLAMGFGASFFGHEPGFVTDAVRAELDSGGGLLIGPVTPHAEDVARLIAELTGVERVAFYNTGTQAVMLAIRLARAATGRAKVVMFNGAFHGIYDATLVRPDFLGDETASQPAVPGITVGSVGDTLLLDYDKPASIDAIRRHAGELAAVLVEPVQSRNPAGQSPQFLRALREVTEEHGIALVFDETITGFRLHAGGAQALFGVEADIVTYGKVVGGGMPIGVVAGKAAYLDCVDGGDWSYGDDSSPPNDERRTFLGGTFCEFPLSMVAARAALERVRDEGPGLQESVNRKMIGLVSRLDALFAEQDVAITTSHFASMLRLVVPRDLELIYYHLLDQGIYTWEGRTLFLSTAHTDEDLDRIVEAFRASIAAMRAGGFLPEQPRPPRELPLTAEQRQLWFAAGVGGSAALAYVDAVLVGLDGPLRPDWLEWALRQVVRRHDALRTGFDPDGERQLEHRAVAVTLPVLDWTDAGVGDGSSADEEFEAKLRDWTSARMREEFDLAAPPLLRAWLVRRGPDRHELVLVGHHLAVDGWSWGVLVDDLARHYAIMSSTAGQPGPAPRFEEFLRWQADLLQGPDGAAARDYWRVELADQPAPLRLPASRTVGAPGRLSAAVPSEMRDRIASVARAAHSSTATVLCAAFELLLCQITGRREFLFGLPSAGQLAMGGQRLIGNCSSVLPIRANLADDTVAHVLAVVHRTLAGAYEHQGVSLAALATGDAELRLPALTALFNVDQPVDVQLPGIRVNARPGPLVAARAALFANITIEPDRLRVDFDFDESVGEADRARWLNAYTEMLAVIADGAHATVDAVLAEVERRTGVRPAQPETMSELHAAPSDAALSDSAREHVSARTDAERRVARVWARVFDAPEPGVHDNFFELGGTSFIATRLVAGLSEEFGTRLPLRAVFDAPTVAELTAVLSGKVVQSGGTNFAGLSGDVVQSGGTAADAASATPQAGIQLETHDGGVYPLSLAQRRLWYVEQLDPGSSYTVFVAVRMVGDLDADVLAECVRETVRRQASLRTRIVEADGEPVQIVDASDGAPLSVVDLTAAGDRDAEVDWCIQQELDRPFDLAAGGLLRTTLLRLDEREHVLLVAIHHIVSDGWSLDVLLHELTTRYGAHVDGVPPDLAELTVQYPDFARWQREWMAGGQFQEQLAYWRERLAGVGPLELPTDRPRPPTSGFAGATHKFALPRSVSDEVRRFSQAERVSVFITLLAAFQALLRGVSGQDDVAVGTPSAGRWVPQTEQLVGFFLNMLVIRADLGGRPTFRELVGQVRDLVLEADANQGVPFDLLVDDLDVVRDPSRSPLFNVMFLLDSTRARWSTAGLELSRVPYDWHTSKFDLSLLIDDVDGELTCVFEYRTDLFDRETIELLAERFETFTGKAIANPAVRL